MMSNRAEVHRTADYLDEFANGHHVMLDSGVLVTVMWNQVKPLR